MEQIEVVDENGQAKKIGWNDILDLARNEPIVHNCITRWSRGDVLLNDALYACIYLLAQKAEKMEKAATDAINNSPHTYLPYRDTKPRL
jgi:hypothetical protein